MAAGCRPGREKSIARSDRAIMRGSGGFRGADNWGAMSVGDSVAPSRVPDALQRPSRCAQSRDPCPASTLKDGPRLCRAPSRGRCAASGARTNRLRINPDPTFKQWTHLRLLAAHFARALPDRIALVVTRAQGRPGAGWHPGPCAGRCTRGGPQVSQSPGLPCAMVYGLLRALPGESSPIAPVASWITGVAARSGGERHQET
jgi:hypothetical protein